LACLNPLVGVRGFVAAISAEAANTPIIGRQSGYPADFQVMRTYGWFDHPVSAACT